MVAQSHSKYKRTFGQASRRNGPTRYQRQQGNGRSNQSHSARELTEEQERAQRRIALKLKRRSEDEAFDAQNGFSRFHIGSTESGNNSTSPKAADGKKNGGLGSGKVKTNEKRGWIFNILPTVSLSYGTKITLCEERCVIYTLPCLRAHRLVIYFSNTCILLMSSDYISK